MKDVEHLIVMYTLIIMSIVIAIFCVPRCVGKFPLLDPSGEMSIKPTGEIIIEPLNLKFKTYYY